VEESKLELERERFAAERQDRVAARALDERRIELEDKRISNHSYQLETDRMERRAEREAAQKRWEQQSQREEQRDADAREERRQSMDMMKMMMQTLSGLNK
jgi:hypothetical protein